MLKTFSNMAFARSSFPYWNSNRANLTIRSTSVMVKRSQLSSIKINKKNYGEQITKIHQTTVKVQYWQVKIIASISVWMEYVKTFAYALYWSDSAVPSGGEHWQHRSVPDAARRTRNFAIRPSPAWSALPCSYTSSLLPTCTHTDLEDMHIAVNK